MKGDFEIIYPLTSGTEGGWAQVANDPGGNTYCGFTERDYPDLPWWSFLKTQPYVWNKVFPQFKDAVKQAYKTHIWDGQIRGDEIADRGILTILFDMAVNKGKTVAIEYAQEAAGGLMTGIMDDATIYALNNPNV